MTNLQPSTAPATSADLSANTRADATMIVRATPDAQDSPLDKTRGPAYDFILGGGGPASIPLPELIALLGGDGGDIGRFCFGEGTNFEGATRPRIEYTDSNGKEIRCELTGTRFVVPAGRRRPQLVWNIGAPTPRESDWQMDILPALDRLGNQALAAGLRYQIGEMLDDLAESLGLLRWYADAALALESGQADPIHAA